MIKVKKSGIHKSKIGAAIVAIFLVFIVFLAGPAAAFTVTWDGTNTSPTINADNTVSIEITKLPTEVYDSNIYVIATNDGDSTTSYIEMACVTNPPGLNGYGYDYGYSNQAHTTKGYGYGYGYAYGSTASTLTCTGTFHPTTAGPYTLQTMNNEYAIGTSKAVTAATNPVYSGGSSTTTTPVVTTDPTTGTTTTTEEFSSPATTPSADEIDTMLAEGNLTQEEINAYKEAAANGELKVVRTLKVEKIVAADGTTTYQSTFTVTFTNTSGKALKDVKIVEVVPKNIASDASQITSTYNYRVILADPILEFTIPSVSVGSTATATYSVDKQVTEAMFSAMDAPLAKGTVVLATPDTNPDATPDTTPDVPGTTPDTTPGSTPGTPAAPMDFTMVIIVLVIILIIAGISYYKKEDIQKMLKK